MKIAQIYLGILLLVLNTSCNILPTNNYPFAGNWRGNGEDSQGNKFNFEARVISLYENKYKILIVDKVGSGKKPFHIIIGELNNNVFVSSADGGKYRGGGKLHSDFYKGFYTGSVSGNYKMWRIK